MGRPPPLVSVVVVTWNGREYLRACLAGLALQTYPNFEVVVVDNASTDGTDALVAAQAPDARLIRNSTNLGFAAANNVGIRATASRYVALLNNDAVPEPDWLAAIVRVADADESVGSVASKMVFAHDPATVNSCGIALDPVGIAWDLWGGYPAATVDRPREIFGPCAGAALYRRAMLEDVGLFDEDYFAYLEDFDLAWRARLRGWRCLFEPSAVVRHAHAGTLGEGSPYKRYLLARNKIWTIAKCAPSPDVWRRLPLIALYDAGAAAFGAARQRDWASVRGRLDGLARLGSALAKRRAIQARRTVSDAALADLYAPLALPWDVPRRYRHLTTTRGLTPTGPHVSPLPQGWGRGWGGSPFPLRITSRIRRWTLKAASWLLPARSQPVTPNPQPRTLRVVVLRPDNLGDVLLSRRAIEGLVGALPGSSVTLVAGPWGAAALAGLPARVVTFPFPGFTRAPKPALLQPYAAMLALACQLRRERFDAALVLRPDHWWGAMCTALAGVPIRVGHAVPEVAPFLTHPVEMHPGESWSTSAVRVTEAAVRALGEGSWVLGDGGRESGPIPPSPNTQYPRPFTLHAAPTPHLGGWLAEHGLDRHAFVVVHPGAGVALKSWPPQRWAGLCDRLPDERVLLTGGPGEETFLDTIRKLAHRPVLVGVGFRWGELGALYRQARLVVGMDSGPLHLATAVGTPTVRMYGPTDPNVFGPEGERSLHRVLRGSLACVPCRELVVAPCGYLQDPPCLASVSVDRVIAEVRRLLEAAAPVAEVIGDR